MRVAKLGIIMNSKPSILFLTEDRYPPVRVDSTILLAKEVVGNLCYKIDWIMQSEEDLPKTEIVSWKGSKVIVGATDTGTSFVARLKKTILRWRLDFRVFKEAAGNDYDIIQTKDRYLGALVTLVAAKWNSTPFVFWISYPEPEASIYIAHQGMARYKWVYLIRGHIQKVLLYKLILRFCDLAIVQSEQMKADIESEGIDPGKMAVMEMGYDSSLFEVIASSPPPKDLPNTISYLGSMGSERRLDFLIRVLHHIHKKYPDVELLFVGGGDREGDEEKIMAEASKYGLADHVTITGRMPQKDALQLISRTAVSLSPFYPTPILNSTSPTKLVEYMALAMPVVANDHPEQKRIIDHSGSGLCVSYDEVEFANATFELLESQQVRDEMGRKGSEYVSKHRQYSILAEKLDTIYRHLLNR